MLISADVGHNFSKFYDGDKKIIYESVLGEYQDGLLAETMQGFVSIDDDKYLVGEDARLESISLTRGKDESWAFTSSYKALLLYGLSRYIGENTNHAVVDLIAGLPILDYKRNKDELKDKFMGDHKMIRQKGRNCIITIRNLKFLPQGFAPARAYIEGNDKTVTLDLGSRNINYTTTERRRLINAHSSSEEIGVLPILGDISKKIAEETGRTIDPFDVYKLFGNPVVRLPGEEINVFSIIDYHIRAYTRSIISVISNHWGNALDVMAIIIFGGGALLIGNELKREYPQAKILSDPQWANCIAQYEYGKVRYR